MTVFVLLLLRETRAGLTHSLTIPKSVGPDRKCPLSTQQVSPAVQPRAELRERVFTVFLRVERNHAVHPPPAAPRPFARSPSASGGPSDWLLSGSGRL